MFIFKHVFSPCLVTSSGLEFRFIPVEGMSRELQTISLKYISVFNGFSRLADRVNSVLLCFFVFR